MREFVGLRLKCYAILCMGEVNGNVLQCTKPLEMKTATDVKRKVKDDTCVLHTIWKRYAVSSRIPVSKI